MMEPGLRWPKNPDPPWSMLMADRRWYGAEKKGVTMTEEKFKGSYDHRIKRWGHGGKKEKMRNPRLEAGRPAWSHPLGERTRKEGAKDRPHHEESWV